MPQKNLEEKLRKQPRDKQATATGAAPSKVCLKPCDITGHGNGEGMSGWN